MIEHGTITVARADFYAPDLAGGELCPLAAWLDLLKAACYAPTRTRIGLIEVSLDRGQCAFSVRFLAERWGWSKSRVDRFLDRIEASGRIHRERTGPGRSPGLTVLTICNYDASQGGQSASFRQNGGTAPGQVRDSSCGTAIDPVEANENNDLAAAGDRDRDSSGTAQNDDSGTKKNSRTQDNKIDSSLRSESAASEDDAPSDSAEPVKSRKPKPRRHVWPADYFDRFWKVWPKKVDIAEAKKVLDGIYRKDNVDFGEIIDGAALLSATIKTKEDKVYCKGPARWLRCGSWTNEVIDRSTAQKNSTNGQKSMTLAAECKAGWNSDAKLGNDILREKANEQRNDHDRQPAFNGGRDPDRSRAEPRPGQRPGHDRDGADGGSRDGSDLAFDVQSARIPGW